MLLSCPTEAQLLLLAVDAAAAPGPVRRHVAGCARCRTRAGELQAAVDAVRAGAMSTPVGSGCLDELAMADLVDGLTPPAERQGRLEHLAVCGRCRHDLGALASLVGDAEIGVLAGTPRPAEHRAVPRRWVAAGGLAAAALLLLAVWPRNATGPSLVHRGPTFTAAEAPVPIGPVDGVAAAGRLEWGAVDGADRYRVTLFTASGRVLLEAETADTIVTVPGSVILVPGVSYLWKVEAGTGGDRWTSSELMEFHLADPPRSDTRPAGAEDSLHLLARRLPGPALVREVRRRPAEVREALGVLLDRAARGAPATRERELAGARRLARAYAVAWNDEFLDREVTRFAAWPTGRALAKVRADSLRRAGVTAFGREGAAAALALWRRALNASAAVADTAGMAAALGNIGAGLARDEDVHSAEPYLVRARDFAAVVGDIRVEANATAELAGLEEEGDPAAAARDYQRAVALHRRIGDGRGLAADYNNLAGLARQAGDLGEAHRYLDSALALNRRDGRVEVAATNLVNLAGLATLDGDFTRAESLYVEALATWRSRGQWADVGDAERGLGELEIRRGDYPAARVHLLAALALYDRTGPVGDAVDLRRTLASVRAAEGDLQGALDELRATQQLADTARLGPGLRAEIALARADLAAQLNRNVEAERLYAAAETLFRRAGDAPGEGAARFGRGLMLLGRDDVSGADRLLGEALRSQVDAGDRRSAALTRVWIGEVALRRGDTVGARAQMERAVTELAGAGDPIGQASAVGARGDLEARAGLPAAAESRYRQALALVGSRTAPEVTWRLHAGLGAVRQARGAADDAAREYRAAIRDVQLAGRTIVLPERHSTYLADKWDVYVRLAQLEHSRGHAAAAFDVSERLRAGELRELLAQGRVSAADEAAPDLAAREQDLRRHIAELTNGLTTDPAGPQAVRGPDVARGAAVAREGLMRAQEAYADLLLEMRDRAPRHAALAMPALAAWREVAAHLAADQALVEYLLSDEGAIAFILTRDTLAAVPLGVDRAALARTVDFARATLQPRGVARLDSLWRTPLRQLHRELMTPVEASGLLAGKRRLIIVPHAELHYLPFAALFDDASGQFLVQRYEVMVTPSASVWLALGTRRPHRRAHGVLALAPRPDALPASRAEMAAVGRLRGADVRTVTGSGATVALFRREAPTRRVIHLATYGVLNKQNPLFSYVELAPAGDDGGTLDVHEVFGLNLSADLVVLSACQTGLASGTLRDVPAGDDWIGLSQAFLTAGAARVIATLWPVQDQASAALIMTRSNEAFMRHETENRRTSVRRDTERTIALALFAAAALAACAGETPTGGTRDQTLPLPPTPFVVSNPVARPAAMSGALASAPASYGLAWISLPSGSLPGASAVTIRVTRTGTQAIALVVDGGFDPVALPAEVGDTIEVAVQGAAADGPTSYVTAVPASQPPRVVRTNPPKHKRDVPLNSIVGVTFSEPMDSVSLARAITLTAGGTPVTGTVVIPPQDSGILRAEFVPSNPLSPLTDYEVRIDGARDRDGEAQDSVIRSDFTTADAAVAPPPLFHMAVNLPSELLMSPKTILVGATIPPIEVTYQGCAIGCDTTYAGDVTLVLGAHPSGAVLGGTTTVPMVNGVATFTGLTVDVQGVYSLVATAPSAVADTSGPFTACAADCWEWRAAMTTPRNLVGVGVVGSTLYAVGGIDIGGAPSGVVEAYDPATDSWSPRAAMPTARYGFGIGVVNGIVYVAGGITASGTTAAVEAYDPATDTWSAKASLPSPTGFPAAGGLNGLLYVVGGQRPDSTIQATVLTYDPATDGWSARAPLPAPRSHVGVAVSGGLLYAIGGLSSVPTLTVTGVMTVYDPATDRWTARTPAGWAGWYPGILLPAAVDVPGKGIVIVGGDDGTTYLSDPYLIGVVYDPAGNQYTSHLSTPVAGGFVASAGVVNGELFLVENRTFRLVP